MVVGCTIQARSVGKIISAAAEAGVDCNQLLDAARIDVALLEDPDSRISYSKFIELYERAAALVGDDAFGLHVAERAGAMYFDVLGYTVMNSPTMGEALARATRYYRIWTDGSTITLEVDGPRAELTYSFLNCPPSLCRHECEYTLAALVLISRSITGVDWNPREVWFQHSKPEATDEHERIFKSPTRFSKPLNRIVFDASLLSLPVVKADPELLVVLDRHAEELLTKFAPQSSFIDEIRHLLGEALRGGDPGLEALAAKMRMSARTLQRKLREEGASHQALLDEMRCDLSKRYLQEARIAIGEVAWLLGFSDVSAFHRAFRRWTGITPKQYRQSLRAEARRHHS